MQGPKATLLLTTLLLTLALPLISQSPTRAQETSHTFPETGKTVRGIFLQYWTTHGGLAQQGYPISDEIILKSTDGKEYRTQFFQRAVFEHHPEFAGTPNEVLLKLVGQTFYERHFQISPPPNQTVNPTNTITFKETGHAIGGKFRDYWEQHGGLAQQGYPMTDEFKMASTDGKEYTTQVFQRAVFELHPEFAGTENEVLLRLLGVEEWEEMNKPLATATPNATTTPGKVSPTPTAVSETGTKHEVETKYGRVEIVNQSNLVINLNREQHIKILEDIAVKRGINGKTTKLVIKPIGDEMEQLFRNGAESVQEVDIAGVCKAFIQEFTVGSEQTINYQISSNDDKNINECKRVQNLSNYKPEHAYLSVGMYRDWLTKYGNFKNEPGNTALNQLMNTIDPALRPSLSLTTKDPTDGKYVVQNPPLDAYIP